MDFICSVLVVADQLLIARLKEACEGALTEKREYPNQNCHVFSIMQAALLY